MAVIELVYAPEVRFRAYCHQLAADLVSKRDRIPLSDGEITQYNTTLGNYDAAWDVAKSPSSNSIEATSAKNVQREKMRNTVQRLVAQVKAAPAVDDTLLAALGMPRRIGRSRPVPTPAGAPVVTTEAVGPTTLRVTAKADPESRSNARPRGVRQVAVATFAGDAPPADATLWGQPTLSGRTAVLIPMDRLAGPATVWVTCWYVSSRNELGPASAPVSTRMLGAGTAVPTAARQPAATPMKIAA